MYRQMVLSMLVLAVFAFTARGQEAPQRQRRLTRLRNRPGLYEVEGSSIAERNPLGLLDAPAAVVDRYRGTTTTTTLHGVPRKLKSSKGSKSDGDAPAKRAKEEKTRQVPDFSMSMEMLAVEFSMSMEFMDMSLSMSM